MTVTGTVSFNNEFIPDSSGLCAYSVPAYRGIVENQSLIQIGLMTGGAGFVAAPAVGAGVMAATNTVIGVAGKLTKYVAAASVGGGLLGYSNYAAAQLNSSPMQVYHNVGQTLYIKFEAYQLKH